MCQETLYSIILVGMRLGERLGKEISLTHFCNDLIFRMTWPKICLIFGISSFMLTGNDHKQMVFWKQFQAGIVSSARHKSRLI